MKAKKGILLGCGLGFVLLLMCGGLAGGIGYLVYTLTKPPADAADRFLALLGEGKTAEAYASAAAPLRSQQSEAGFTAEVRRLGLTDYASSSWPNRNIRNNHATLEGSIQTVQGGTIPLTVTLLKEGEEWRVLTITGPDAGVRPTPVAQDTGPRPTGPKKLPRFTVAVPTGMVRGKPTEVPSLADLNRLVTASVLDIDQAIRAADVKALHAKIARSWQKEMTAKIQAVLKTFIDDKVDLSGVKGVAAELDPDPAIDNGLLKADGVFPTKPVKVTFKFQYAYEGLEWRLAGFEVKVAPNEGGD